MQPGRKYVMVVIAIREGRAIRRSATHELCSLLVLRGRYSGSVVSFRASLSHKRVSIACAARPAASLHTLRIILPVLTLSIPSHR